MRLAFVIRLGPGTRPAEGLFEGSVEEVDSSIQRRFHSVEELLKFLGQRFDAAGLCNQGSASIGRASIEKKVIRKKRTPS